MRIKTVRLSSLTLLSSFPVLSLCHNCCLFSSNLRYQCFTWRPIEREWPLRIFVCLCVCVTQQKNKAFCIKWLWTGISFSKAKQMGLTSSQGTGPFPREMSFPVPKGASWNDLYDHIRYSSLIKEQKEKQLRLNLLQTAIWILKWWGFGVNQSILASSWVFSVTKNAFQIYLLRTSWINLCSLGFF